MTEEQLGEEKSRRCPFCFNTDTAKIRWTLWGGIGGPYGSIVLIQSDEFAPLFNMQKRIQRQDLKNCHCLLQVSFPFNQ